MAKTLRKYAIAIHGGAGTISRNSLSKQKERAYLEALQKAVSIGNSILKRGGRSLDAVVEVVRELENSALFNAGRGSVFNYNGTHEMDASLMDGRNLKTGAVSGVKLIKNPIIMAREVMKYSKHVLLQGDEALEFAMERKLEFKPQSYFFDEYRYRQWQKTKLRNAVALDHDMSEVEKYGTVGAVAIDRRGNLAAATSTGGVVNKRYGRIGDSPIVGAGTYADNTSCAVSCTGQGEYFIRLVAAHEVSALMRLGKLSLHDAVDNVIMQSLKKIGGKGGLIAVDRNGNICMSFNTKGMYRASKREGEDTFIGIYN